MERENYANPQVGRVYAGNGVAPTLSTMQGGDKQPKVIVKSNICIDDTQGVEDKPRVYNNTAPSLRCQRSGLKTIVAMRGRYVSPSGNKETKQQLEPQMNGTCNALTTVQKDNLVLENTVINDRGFKDKEPQISQGYAPTLRAESHGNLPKVVEKVVRYQMTEVSVEQYLVIEGLLQLLLQGVMAMQINMFIQHIESEN